VIEIVTPEWVKKRLPMLYAQKDELIESLFVTEEEETRTEIEKSLSDVKYEIKLLTSMAHYMNRKESAV